MRRSAPLVLLLTLVAGPLLSQTDRRIPHRQDRVPNRPYPPEEAIARMTVPEGFAVELVASEPQIVNPVAMTFDDRGRIWVTESLEYPRKQEGEGRDRIKILEDSDGDGRAETVTVFADDLNIPSGIAVGFGGVWVLNAPDLLFFREADGRAVGREVVVTGFGRTDVHELPNSLTWGPDGWLYGLNGVFNQSRVVSGKREYRFTCALFRVHPRTREFQIVCEGTSNPWGLVWSPDGSAIVSACHWAKDHVFHFVETAYYQRQAGAYPRHAWPIGSVSDHGHQKTAYCGLAYLDSDAYPETYRNRLYMGNVHGNCINVDVLHRDGSTYISRAAPDILTANDAWFMPVSQKVGPDGCLYILDWYDRYHCYQDANRDPEGIDRQRGRLYRLRYGDSPRAPRFDLTTASDERLIELLGSANIYFRQRAQRLLTERDSEAVRRRLRRSILDPTVGRKGRLHALWALVGTGKLEPELHEALLLHPDPVFRAWGVRAAGNLGDVTDIVRERLSALSTDSAPDVQLQVAIAAGKVSGLDPLRALVGVLSSCGTDKLIPAVVWPNLHPLLETRAGEFSRLAGQADLTRSPAIAHTLPRVVERVLAAEAPDFAAVGDILSIAARGDAELARECLSVVAARVPHLSAPDLEELKVHVRPAVEAALLGDTEALPTARLLAARLGFLELDPDTLIDTFLSRDEKDAVRLQALDALILDRHARVLEAVDHVLASGSSMLIAGAVASLARIDDPRVAEVVLARYTALPDDVKPLAIDLLLERRTWARRLLDAVLAGKLPRGTLHANHLRTILEGNDRESIWAIEKKWGKIRKERSPEREKVVQNVLAELRSTPGDPKAGQAVFAGHCSQCHVIYGRGRVVGPDLTSNGRASFEQLVSSVLDPSLVIGPGYETTVVVTTDGRVLTGLIAESSESRIVLNMQGERRETIARADVKYTKTTDLSLMPEGLETVFSRRDLHDLFAFLALDGPPDGPKPRAIPGAPDWLRDWLAGGDGDGASSSGSSPTTSIPYTKD